MRNVSSSMQGMATLLALSVLCISMPAWAAAPKERVVLKEPSSFADKGGVQIVAEVAASAFISIVPLLISGKADIVGEAIGYYMEEESRDATVFKEQGELLLGQVCTRKCTCGGGKCVLTCDGTCEHKCIAVPHTAEVEIAKTTTYTVSTTTVTGVSGGIDGQIGAKDVWQVSGKLGLSYSVSETVSEQTAGMRRTKVTVGTTEHPAANHCTKDIKVYEQRYADEVKYKIYRATYVAGYNTQKWVEKTNSAKHVGNTTLSRPYSVAGSLELGTDVPCECICGKTPIVFPPPKEEPRIADLPGSGAPGAQAVVIPAGIAATTVASSSQGRVIVHNPTPAAATIQTGAAAVALKPGESASVSNWTEPILFTAAPAVLFALFPRGKDGDAHATTAGVPPGREAALPAQEAKIELLGASPGVSPAAGGMATPGAAAALDTATAAGVAQPATRHGSTVIREILNGTDIVPTDAVGLYGDANSAATTPMTVCGDALQNTADFRLYTEYADGQKIAYYGDRFADLQDSKGNISESVVSIRGIENKNQITTAKLQAVDASGNVLSEKSLRTMDASLKIEMPKHAPPGSTVPVTVTYADYVTAARSECFAFDERNYVVRLTATPADLKVPPFVPLNASGVSVVNATVPAQVVGFREWQVVGTLETRPPEADTDVLPPGDSVRQTK